MLTGIARRTGTVIRQCFIDANCIMKAHNIDAVVNVYVTQFTGKTRAAEAHRFPIMQYASGCVNTACQIVIGAFDSNWAIC
jgi:hypothetical protein